MKLPKNEEVPASTVQPNPFANLNFLSFCNYFL